MTNEIQILIDKKRVPKFSSGSTHMHAPDKVSISCVQKVPSHYEMNYVSQDYFCFGLKTQ